MARMSAASCGFLSSLRCRAASREVFQAADAVMAFLQSLLDSLASPSEASFGLASVAAAEFDGDLGLEGAALVTGKATGP